jgi:periplasmic divalent cation tolerance protein
MPKMEENQHMMVFYVPCKNRENAQLIAKKLLGEQLIKCANILNESDSLYMWEGKLVEEKEVIMILKANFQADVSLIQEMINKEHSYDVPCIIYASVKQLCQEYQNWLIDA